jgi:hypothetical protein
VKIVDAIADAYRDEVVFKEQSRVLGERDTFNRSLKNIERDLADKAETYTQIAQESGTTDDAGNEALRQLTMKRLDRVEIELMRLEDEQAKSEKGDGATNATYFEKRISQLRERQAELEKQLIAPAPSSIELSARLAELKVLQGIANEMAAQQVRMEIDSHAPQPIELIQKAVVSPVD